MSVAADGSARGGGRKLATYLGVTAVVIGLITLTLGLVQRADLVGPGLLTMTIGFVAISSARRGTTDARARHMASPPQTARDSS